MSNSLYRIQKTILMTLDPVHIGTGGYRLGRVDNSIVREPGINVPKIPGTSLSGACRSYAAMQFDKRECAGQGSENGHCKEGLECPICYTFGTGTGPNSGYAGTINISDARILFFPVRSMVGPVWITTKERLEDASGEKIPLNNKQEDKITYCFDKDKKEINLGWLMLEVDSKINSLEIKNAFEKIKDDKNKNACDAVLNRLVIVNDKIFSQVVNSNLEVRTSVSIDPETGTAKEGALFTYEAIPRSTWLWCDIIEDDYYKNEFPKNNKKLNWSSPLDVLNAGMDLIEYLGVGGMGTRGFGRVKIMGKEVK